MYQIIIAPQAQKELKVIKKSYGQSISLALQEIKDDPTIGKPLSKQLIGRFSYRVGIYRIIYKVNKKDKMITVISAGHREIVYK